MASEISDERALFLLTCTLAASDHENTQWPADNVQFARSMLTRANGVIHSPEQIAAEIDEDRVDRLLPLILEKRKCENALNSLLKFSYMRRKEWISEVTLPFPVI